MASLSALRRPRQSVEQLDLFSSMFGSEPVPPADLPQLPPIVVDASASESPPARVAPDTSEQATIPECDTFVIDLPEVVKQSRDFRIADEHRIGHGSLADKARDNVAAIRTLKAIEAEDRDATEDEKTVLARYVGWGAMPNVFNHWQPDHLQATSDAVKELLTPAEFESAKGSTPNAHYTSPMVIEAVWDGLRQIGVSAGAQVLEPAIGVGHFFGLMPNDMRAAHRTGVELDSITARIAQNLYPDATIFARGFEETPLPDNYMDVCVGNVPFGEYAVHDPEVPRSMTRAIHDYFLAKSLSKLRPGGVMALITSRYTMDKENESVRKYLSESADLLGAIRLPNTAFKENAGTEVTTDIIFLQKREPGTPPGGHAWRSLEMVDLGGDDRTRINEYFAAHPEMMLGEMELQRGMYRSAEPTLAGELSPELLARAVGQLPAGVYVPRDRQRPPPAPVLEHDAFDGVKDGAYLEHDGAICIRNGNSIEQTSLSETAATRVRGQMVIRDALREVFRTQLEEMPEAEITTARLLLNRQYDNYTRKHGPLSSRENVRAFSGDPDQPLLLSLESYDAEKKTATKTAIFDRRTLQRHKPVDRVDTAAEALVISLNEAGKIDWPTMQRLTGRSPRRMQRELDAMIYRNPEGDWETADQYLSGDVRAKLRAAQAASGLDPAFARNVAALTAVQPEDLLPGDISARLGSSWIPPGDVKLFLVETLDIPAPSISVAHSGAIASWFISAEWGAKSAVSNTTTYGTSRATAIDLVDDALNGRVPTIYDLMPDETRVVNQLETIAAREAQQKLKDKFSEWIWQDEERAQRLSRHYNDTFNNIRLRTYDGSHLTFPGLNRTELRNNDLDGHQKDAVWRIIQNDNTLLAHCVGAGKTLAITAACMELRRLGLAEKPTIAVPNHLVDQWGTAFLQAYPQANIFVAGKDHFATGNRQKAMARIATGNYDAVIVAHNSFEKIPVSDDTFENFVGRQIDQLEEAVYEAKSEKGDTRRIVKELEKAKKRLVAKVKERADRENKDDGVTFEQMGIDRIFVDEADAFKNLGVVTKMQRIAGLSNTESNRALDMYIKTQYLAERNGGVVFATGTPISNTMAEMYTMQRYLAPKALRAAGVEHFDAWAANFGEAVTSLELAPDGSGYRMHTRFAKFVNMPELLSMFRTFSDVQTADMLKLPRPALVGGKPHIVAVPASPELKDFVATLVERAKNLRGVDPSIDNMLKITGDGRKAALDMRIIDPCHEPGDTKVSRAVDRIHAIWANGHDKRLTQLVFCDISTPHPDRFNVYDEVRDRLVERGIPEGEIAFIHDADTDAKKKALYDSVNAGRVRILMGSTEKMGAGMNVQKRLKALHHLDAPWRPRDIEQREGRILRQGNENETVEIHRYVTEGSFDAYMWQCLETKARFINQVMNGSVTVRQAEDLEGGALTYAEIKAIASGNPAVMEKVKVDTEVRKLDQLRASHINQQHKIRWQVKSLPEDIAQSTKYHAAFVADIATRDEHSEEDFAMTIGNREYTGKDARANAGEALNQVAYSWRHDQKRFRSGAISRASTSSRRATRSVRVRPICSSVARRFIRRTSTSRTR